MHFSTWKTAHFNIKFQCCGKKQQQRLQRGLSHFGTFYFWCWGGFTECFSLMGLKKLKCFTLYLNIQTREGTDTPRILSTKLQKGKWLNSAVEIVKLKYPQVVSTQIPPNVFWASFLRSCFIFHCSLLLYYYTLVTEIYSVVLIVNPSVTVAVTAVTDSLWRFFFILFVYRLLWSAKIVCCFLALCGRTSSTAMRMPLMRRCTELPNWPVPTTSSCNCRMDITQVCPTDWASIRANPKVFKGTGFFFLERNKK